MFKTGYGGGFNERENLVYNEREESDGEYDEVDVFYYWFNYFYNIMHVLIFNNFPGSDNLWS